MNNDSLILELVPSWAPEFDNRSYWSSTRKIAGTPVTCRWVAEGEFHMTAQQFTEHALRVFNRLQSYVSS